MLPIGSPLPLLLCAGVEHLFISTLLEGSH